MAQLSILNCGDLSGSPVGEYISNIAGDTTSGINIVTDVQNSNLASIVIGGIEYQATIYWEQTTDILVVKTRANRGAWKTCRCNGLRSRPTITCTDLDDAHFAGVLGIDPDGYIHIAYDHHATALNYRKSTVTIQSGSTLNFGAEASMLGTNEANISYPRFFLDPTQTILYFLFRDDDGDNDADLRLYQYDHGTTTWETAAGLTAGLLYNGDPSGDVIYSTSMKFTSDWDAAGNGYAVIGCLPRRDQNLSDQYHSAAIAFTDGVGNWYKPDLTAQTIPMTLANSTALYTGVIGTDSLGRPQIATDSTGRVHVVYIKNGALFHSVWDSGTWTGNTVEASFASISSDYNIAVDDNDVAHIIFANFSDGHLKRYTSDPDDYTTWTLSTISTTAITDEIYHPNYDERAWREEQELLLVVPYTVTPPFLLNGVQHHYGLADIYDDSSFSQSTRFDLTNVNTTTFSGSQANFASASSQQLTVEDAADTSPTGAMTIGVRVNMTDKAAARGLFGKDAGGTNRAFYSLYNNTTDRFNFNVTGNGAVPYTTVVADSLGIPSTATLYHVLCDHDPTADLIGIQVNNGTKDTAAHAANIFDGTDLLRIGRGNSTQFMNGSIHSFTLWNRVLSAQERTAWYNGGTELDWDRYGLIAPTIYSHGDTANVNVDEGNTAVATVAAWGDLTMTEALTGADAADFQVTDNADGTWTLEFAAPATAGTRTVILTLTNDAGSDATEFTVETAGVPGVAPTITSSLTRTVLVGETAVATITATGDEPITWSITGGADELLFSIVGATGVLTFADPAEEGAYEVEITATNAEGSDIETFTINVVEAGVPLGPAYSPAMSPAFSPTNPPRFLC
jgi:hypothetical protein